VRERLAAARLYLCTDARRNSGDLADFLDVVLAGGVDVVQLRDPALEALEELAVAEVCADAAHRHGALFAVNNRADVARAVRADVLHLGQHDLPVQLAREIVGDDVVVGRSTHTPDEASAAATEPGVDYFCVGPVWPTPTKPGRPAAGLGLVRYASELSAGRPWFAIGGVEGSTLEEVQAAGATRIVVVRALTEAADPGAAAAHLAGRLRAAALAP